MCMKIKLIIAIDKNGVMGKENTLPWRLRDDLKNFKKETLGYPLIMGSNTFLSLPGVLPDREHIVLSTTLYGDEKKSVFTSIKESIEYCKESGYSQVFIIGGANVIRQFTQLNLFDELIITHVDCTVDGDTQLDIDTDLKLDKWDIYETTHFDKSEVNEYSFKVCKYIKKHKRFY